MRLNGEAHTIEATAQEIAAARPRWPIPPVNGEAASLGARLSELLAQETPEDLLGRLSVFKQSVEEVFG